MRSRCLLSCVDRLPTIRETQDEAETLDGPGFSMDEYMDSIRELSQPPQPCYPLHGPLRGHRRWITRAAVPPCPLLQCPGTHAATSPIEVSDVSLTFTQRASRYLHQNVMEAVEAPSVFAGL